MLYINANISLMIMYIINNDNITYIYINNTVPI